MTRNIQEEETIHQQGTEDMINVKPVTKPQKAICRMVVT